MYLRQLLQPQLDPLQAGIDIPDGHFWVLPLGVERAADHTTCITTETERSEGLLCVPLLKVCDVLLPQFTLSHDTSTFNGAIIIPFVCTDTHRHCWADVT